MRGCLFVLVVGALILGLLAWFASPLLASAAVGFALDNGGFTAATTTVTVRADPPPRILLGHADTVEIVATDVAFRTFHARSLDLVLTDVDIVGRKADRIEGTIVGATMTSADGVATEASVDIDGDAAAADTTVIVDGATVDRVVRATLLRQIGVAPTRTELVAPDIIRIVSPGATIEGRLIVDASGSVALSTRLGETPIL